MPIGSIRCSGRSYWLGRLDRLDLSDRADQADRSDRPRTLKFRTIPSRLPSSFHFCNLFSDVPMHVRSVKSDRRGGSAGWTEDFENLDHTLPGGGPLALGPESYICIPGLDIGPADLSLVHYSLTRWSRTRQVLELADSIRTFL